jgi:hypothetical protein
MILLLTLHSWVRWLVLVSLTISIVVAARGLWLSASFSPVDNAFRHWTATIAHLQLILGMTLLLRNPFLNTFRVVHLAGMITAVVLVTIGSALAKRRTTDREKFITMFRWFLASLLIILLCIPWPFSPLAQRPLFRTF